MGVTSRRSGRGLKKIHFSDGGHTPSVFLLEPRDASAFCEAGRADAAFQSANTSFDSGVSEISISPCLATSGRTQGLATFRVQQLEGNETS